MINIVHRVDLTLLTTSGAISRTGSGCVLWAGHIISSDDLTAIIHDSIIKPNFDANTSPFSSS